MSKERIGKRKSNVRSLFVFLCEVIALLLMIGIPVFILLWYQWKTD